ncbi:hemophore-related protein [Mycobacterium sp. OTB74]|uniref:hemophore-related protein n=1 Tax=Mycobacterium sp. OTB74 TaxID=1853452 RepID=UPI00247635BE|nr:hemophore-related protein [Mycobacterium sp. OTB74]MDH6243981.1 hemophore-related protein [Mycobacterium sp. OTB74]
MTKSASRLRNLLIGSTITAAAFCIQPATATADVTSALAPLVTTTCTYNQITAALAAEAPDLASLLSSRPQAQARLQQFLALTVDQRQQRVDQQLAVNPKAQGLIADRLGSPQAQELTQVANTCNTF